ncbi:hypothetical protein BY458DRAFT_448445, partial [Sporodiniella umbellata]
DQCWRFVYEDMIIDNIDYKIDTGKIIKSNPKAVVQQILDNSKSSQTQTMKFTYNEKITNTSTFEHTHGFEMSIGTTFKTGIPFIAEGEIKIDASTKHEWKYGEQTSFEKSYQNELPVQCAPFKKIIAKASVTESIINIPYKITWKSKRMGTKISSEGIYKGVSTWNLTNSFEES